MMNMFCMSSEIKVTEVMLLNISHYNITFHSFVRVKEYKPQTCSLKSDVNK